MRLTPAFQWDHLLGFVTFITLDLHNLFIKGPLNSCFAFNATS